MPEIGQDAAQYVDPYSTEMIKNKISELLHDNILRSNMIEKGYTRAKQFSWANTSEKVHKYYRDLHYEKTQLKKAG
jgi:glycosyltransferase involved in cell wall biosynthesis